MDPDPHTLYEDPDPKNFGDVDAYGSKSRLKSTVERTTKHKIVFSIFFI